MRILISNDDGIHAPGLYNLYQAIKDLGTIDIAAPDTQRSASAHAITVNEPLRAQKIALWDNVSGYAISGTPADCVKLALTSLLDEPPDIVISGINLGPNAGICVIYSGTVSAATEGVLNGIPSMAISLDAFKDPIWQSANFYAHKLAINLYEQGLPPGVLLNVNVPNLPLDRIKGTMITRMGQSRFVEKFDKRVDPQGNTYYWLAGWLENMETATDTDMHAIGQGLISLTPIHVDLTHHPSLESLRNWQL